MFLEFKFITFLGKNGAFSPCSNYLIAQKWSTQTFYQRFSIDHRGNKRNLKRNGFSNLTLTFVEMDLKLKIYSREHRMGVMNILLIYRGKRACLSWTQNKRAKDDKIATHCGFNLAWDWWVLKSTGSGVRGPGFKFWLHHLMSSVALR